jgi:hypothetical protein
MTPTEIREAYVAAVALDLVGPVGGPGEVLDRMRPSDRYVTGILYPSQPAEQADTAAIAEELAAEEDDDRDGSSDEEPGPGEPVPMTTMRRPSSMGISFLVEGPGPILVAGSAGRYARRWRGPDGTLVEVDLGRESECWVRTAWSVESTLPLSDELVRFDAGDGLVWWLRGLRTSVGYQVTLVLENGRPFAPGRTEMEENAFFQVEFTVRVPEGSRLLARRAIDRQGNEGDQDLRVTRLIYRKVEEFAVGHVGAARWGTDDRGFHVGTSWLPRQPVASMSAAGHEVFTTTAEAVGGAARVFNAAWLANASVDELRKCLDVVPASYEKWLSDVERERLPGIAETELRATAATQVATARNLCSRIRRGIHVLVTDSAARRAFQLAQEAMVRQKRWAESDAAATLAWRPFQLGFQLLAIAGLAHPDGAGAADRRTMDLLWFPTGGGKTEAYLALIAFLLFHRRLRNGAHPDRGAGVATLIRYTLRLLTVQQFERASRVVLACDRMRRDLLRSGDASLGSTPFSIGLWVGNDATPGKVSDARGDPRVARTAQQLSRCPACQGRSLRWDADAPGPYVIRCEGEGCPVADAPLPIHTIDEQVYLHRPSLVLGTVDKFAQIARKPDSHALFGLGPGEQPPDLILQDELHLISGPLGTVVGLYEAAIDQLCTRAGVPPKIIGSTATIRRADEQVLGLFNRSVAQFPPPVIDWDDSCFAVRDDSVPGRLYVGVTSAGRSPKFALQAVCGALLQRASETVLPDDAARDPYWTLLAYFNSMRELGGALVMMLDDVNDSIQLYASSHPGERPRPAIDDPKELTSRVKSEDIPNILADLERSYPAQDASVVLATNMISVGVDIPRLGLMVVNGQPKSMAEYIQATSRVGRNKVPGVIFTVYNAGRPRDRAHYESFRTWHQSLYREVEATSVTPFAPRARDKALHAAVVILARHLVSGMLADPPVLDDTRRAELETLTAELVRRVQRVDPEEVDETRAQIASILDAWAGRGPSVSRYWDDHRPGQTLLVSAEKAAEARATTGAWTHAAVPTPNSMREVEPSVKYRLVHALARPREGQDG